MSKLLKALFAASVISFSSVSLASDLANTIEINKPVLQTININKATQEQLASLKGIGVKKAKAIIAYRQQYGDFNHIEDLLNVKGVG